MLLFSRIQRYYDAAGQALGLGALPARPIGRASLVLVPVGGISRLTEAALSAALTLGDTVVALTVAHDPEVAARLLQDWDRWSPGVELEVLDSPQRSLVGPVLDYVERAQAAGQHVAVLIPEVEPRRRRYQVLQNQRGLLLATALRARSDAVVCTLPYRLDI